MHHNSAFGLICSLGDTTEVVNVEKVWPGHAMDSGTLVCDIGNASCSRLRSRVKQKVKIIEAFIPK